ncbi:hypothetical protein MAR_017294 [Mya arenaria]|uniref:Uncharacterized protein n=1 Tax=Mya arenaria TaxID=6604 RepID=A0ABY7EEY8_MYAAR|nr:hypothetical protein MAR_017294 [Mya arenaria]
MGMDGMEEQGFNSIQEGAGIVEQGFNSIKGGASKANRGFNYTKKEAGMLRADSAPSREGQGW